jgi:peroxisomal membrane protein 4
MSSSSSAAFPLNPGTGGNYYGGILNNPSWQPYLALIKGFRNGLVYGVKIRFPHALVMTFLFRSGTFRERLRVILKATYAHARNLAFFVLIYKSLCLVLKRLHGGKEASYHSFLSGLIGGYLIFGEDNNINNQVTKQAKKYISSMNL